MGNPLRGMIPAPAIPMRAWPPSGPRALISVEVGSRWLFRCSGDFAGTYAEYGRVAPNAQTYVPNYGLKR
eukprot:scaffold77322_cov58-Phaeocystis_antarctica.AAC.9